MTIDYAERQIKATENYINDTANNFRNQQINNEKKLEDLNKKLDSLKQALPELNDLVCDKRGDPCDAICGGAGCSSCGSSISCENGAKQQAESALNIANSTETALRNKEAKANDFIRNVYILFSSYRSSNHLILGFPNKYKWNKNHSSKCI